MHTIQQHSLYQHTTQTALVITANAKHATVAPPQPRSEPWVCPASARCPGCLVTLPPAKHCTPSICKVPRAPLSRLQNADDLLKGTWVQKIRYMPHRQRLISSQTIKDCFKSWAVLKSWVKTTVSFWSCQTLKMPSIETTQRQKNRSLSYLCNNKLRTPTYI